MNLISRTQERKRQDRNKIMYIEISLLCVRRWAVYDVRGWGGAMNFTEQFNVNGR